MSLSRNVLVFDIMSTERRFKDLKLHFLIYFHLMMDDFNFENTKALN